MYDLCILGAGITGLSLLLLLHEAKFPLSKVAIVDPYFDGGDLARMWTTVQSNTPWSKTLNALQATCPCISIPAALQALPSDQSTPLAKIAELLRSCAAPLLRATKQIQALATQAEYKTSDKSWTIMFDRPISSSGVTPLKARILVFAQGAVPRTMDLPIPSIPLDIGLDKSRLKHYLQPGQRLLVFGTMHSGTLVMQNAVDCSAAVVGLYNSPQPFTWSRDGAYDGIKREAADIADAIVAGRLPVELVHVQDTAAVIRASSTADWSIFAMGFQPRRICLVLDGVERSCGSYDGATGALREVPAAWGFGVAYPNRAPDGVHWDVSVAAFLSHMKSQLPSLLSAAAPQ